MSAWAYRSLPRREDMEHNRFVRPFARRQELWRFTRRSVPRGVAIGLLVGILALIPGIQIVGAAMMCVPFRGNIPIAAAMTFISIPPTTIGIFLPGAIWVGNKFGYHADLSTITGLYDRGAPFREWVYWLLSDAAPALIIGLFVIATLSAAVGYVIASFGWRWWVGRKRRHKLEALRAAREAE